MKNLILTLMMSVSFFAPHAAFAMTDENGDTPKAPARQISKADINQDISDFFEGTTYGSAHREKAEMYLQSIEDTQLKQLVIQVAKIAFPDVGWFRVEILHHIITSPCLDLQSFVSFMEKNKANYYELPYDVRMKKYVTLLRTKGYEEGPLIDEGRVGTYSLAFHFPTPFMLKQQPRIEGNTGYDVRVGTYSLTYSLAFHSTPFMLKPQPRIEGNIGYGVGRDPKSEVTNLDKTKLNTNPTHHTEEVD